MVYRNPGVWNGRAVVGREQDISRKKKSSPPRANAALSNVFARMISEVLEAFLDVVILIFFTSFFLMFIFLFLSSITPENWFPLLRTK